MPFYITTFFSDPVVRAPVDIQKGYLSIEPILIKNEKNSNCHEIYQHLNMVKKIILVLK